MAKKEPPEEGAPIWMGTYADLMSLLLCFFVMLFAMSIITPKRFQALADVLTQDFTGRPSPGAMKTKRQGPIIVPVDSAARSRRTQALLGGTPAPRPQGEQTEVHTMLLSGEVLRVVRFDLGSDVLTERTQRDLRAILPLLQGSSHKIMVKGHTTPTEGGGDFQHDTDLAFYRALRVVDYFVSLGLKQDFFEIVVDTASAPRLNLLPTGTDPKFAGASAEILLLDQTLRSLRE